VSYVYDRNWDLISSSIELQQCFDEENDATSRNAAGGGHLSVGRSASSEIWHSAVKFLRAVEGPRAAADVDHISTHKVSAAAVIDTEVRMCAVSMLSLKYECGSCPTSIRFHHFETVGILIEKGS
jgi:hypothetical protein